MTTTVAITTKKKPKGCLGSRTRWHATSWSLFTHKSPKIGTYHCCRERNYIKSADVFGLHLETNRSHLSMREYSDNAEMTSIRVKNKEVHYPLQVSRATDLLNTVWCPMFVIRAHAQTNGIYLFYTLVFDFFRLVTSFVRLYSYCKLFKTNQNARFTPPLL